MTKSEAVQAMMRGEKVTHVHFTSNEWMTQPNHFVILLEDGVTCDSHDFWRDRASHGWDNGYSIWQGGE